MLLILFILISSLFLISGLMPIVIFFLFFAYFFYIINLSKIKKTIFSILAFLVVISSLFHIKNLNQLERVRSSESFIYKVQYFINSGDLVGKQNLERVIKVISSNLFIGLGADGGLELLQKEREILTESFVNKRNAHNNILEILLRYGIIGLSIYLIIIFNLIQKARYTDNYFLSWFLIVFIISGITESYLQRQISLVFFVFLSLLLYIYKYETKLT
jgi:O-antigen ligase